MQNSYNMQRQMMIAKSKEITLSDLTFKTMSLKEMHFDYRFVLP